MKRIISLALAASLLLSGFVFADEYVIDGRKIETFKSKTISGGHIVEKEYFIDIDGKVKEFIKESDKPEIVVFQGYMKNVDYSDPTKFLTEGKQTVVTDRVKEFSKNINDKKDLSTVREILRKVAAIPRNEKVPKFTVSADDILKHNGIQSCSQYATVFIAAAKHKGIPTVFIHAIDTNFYKGKIKEANSTHSFVEVYIAGENKWYLVDPTTGTIFLDYDVNNFNYSHRNGIEYYLFSKSLDLAEADLDSFDKIVREKPVEFIKNKDFKWEGYKKPNYKEMRVINFSL